MAKSQPEMPDPTQSPLSEGDLDDLASRYVALREQIRRVIVGQHEIVEQLLVALFCQGHTLVIGVPGLAKTLLVRTLARSLDLRFARIQFTPDMMPSDILGTELIQTDPETGERRLRFQPGPIFANLILADEINRTPPKTQAALLEAMAEHQISAGGQTRMLEAPFIVVATQNPIEQEGTYPLPEAQLDRFLFSLWIDYPSRAEERLIAGESERIIGQAIDTVFSRDDLVRYRALLARIPVSDHVLDHAVDLVRATRPIDPTCPRETVRPFVSWGAGPRAAQHLVLASKCLAALEGRPTPGADDVRRVATSVLRHRFVLNYAAAGEGLTSLDMVKRVLEAVREPDYE